MDDLQFRRSIYADPSNQSADILAAQRSDPVKQQCADELNQLDKKLKQALKVPVPEGLAEQLILKQTLASHQQHKRISRRYLAVAASVAILAGIMINYFSFSSHYHNLGDYALAHVYHEQEDFSNNNSTRISLSDLNQKMTAFDGHFNHALGQLIAADYCRFDGMKSLHLVFKGISDIVTVFVVPKNEQLAFSENFSDQQLRGKSISFKNTNIIIVANKDEALTPWQQALSDNISWHI